MGAAALLDDKAATTVAAVPVSGAWRRAVTLTLATPLLAISWWVQSEVGSPPGVGLATESVLEALTLLVAMLAVAAVVIARGGIGTGGAPTAPALVVLVGLMMGVPERVAVYPVSDHMAHWAALLVLASVALAVASRDPACRSTTVISRQNAGS